MNRISLRLYSPPQEVDVEKQDPQVNDFTDVIPFDQARRAVVFSGRFPEPAHRARLIRSNSCCPHCSLHDIEPLELEDAVISPKSRLPIPGTATIVGFHCHSCGTEWPVYEVARRNG